MIPAWSRVKVAKWSTTHDVRVRTVRKVLDKFEDTGHQLIDQLIGVVVPIRFKDGVVVMPLEFYSGGRQWVKCDCANTYFVVLEKWLEVLGEAYDEEVVRAKRGVRAHKLTVRDPKALLWARAQKRYATESIDYVLHQNTEAARGVHKRKRGK